MKEKLKRVFLMLLVSLIFYHLNLYMLGRLVVIPAVVELLVVELILTT